MNIFAAIREKLNAEKPSKGRFERKFVVSNLDSHQIESILRVHPAGFREIFYKRQINNIYLDTIDLKAYFDNVYGNTTRVKVRIRWYGSTFGKIKDPVLEMKIKNGLAGRKRSYRLNPFVLDNGFGIQSLHSALDHPKLPAWVKEKLAGYQPALLNSYQRKYFVSADKKVRITLDEKMTYYSIGPRNNTFIQRYEEKNAVILEMKYALDAADMASGISQHFPVRMTKSSKYVNGIDIFHPNLAT